MAEKCWTPCEFAMCLSCGDDVEVLTDSDIPGEFYDGDRCRCVACGWLGSFVAEEGNRSYVDWDDDAPGEEEG